MPQRTSAEALDVIQLAVERLADVPPGSDAHDRLSASIIELQQVVSMLSDAAHQTPDVVARGRQTVATARQLLAELEDHATYDSDV